MKMNANMNMNMEESAETGMLLGGGVEDLKVPSLPPAAGVWMHICKSF